jgi:hypothetical protein
MAQGVVAWDDVTASVFKRVRGKGLNAKIFGAVLFVNGWFGKGGKRSRFAVHRGGATFR